MSAILQCGKHQLDLSRPHIMGILNITPDSFSDGGQYNTLDAALHRAGNMLEAGASLLDVGASRPGRGRKRSVRSKSWIVWRRWWKRW